MIYIFVLILVIVLTLVGIGLVLYQKNVKVASSSTSVNINNPGYKMFVDLETTQKKRDEFRKMVPSYVSKDVYKDISNKADRDKKFLEDYFYLLDLAIRAYQSNPKGDIMSNEAYLPVLAWAKFSIDYDKYVRALDAKAIESRFASTYGKTPNIEGTMKFLRSVQDSYSKDPAAFNKAIFGDTVSQESLVPKCSSYSPVEKTVYQEVYVTRASTDVCSYGMQKNSYAGLPKDVLVRKLPADFWMLLRIAVNVSLDKPSFENVMTQQKYLPVLVFSKFVVNNHDLLKSLPDDITSMYVSQNSDLLAKPESLKIIDTFVSRYRSNPSEIDAIVYKACTSAGVAQKETPKPAKKDPNSYLLLPTTQRNQAIMYDFLNVFKNAVESIVTNKASLLKVYQSRKSDVEFLNIYEFVPALIYAKFIEDNKEYLNQVDPNERKQMLTSLYPDFMTNERFYTQGIHVQVFLIIASNLYDGSPRDVDIAIYGTLS